jgi:hypothetical protein
MLKKSRIYLATLLTLIIGLSSVISTFALEPNQELNDKEALVVADENNQVQAVITKNLRMPIGTNTPDVTFEFTSRPISVDGDTSVLGPSLNPNLTITFGPTDTDHNDPVDNIISIKDETEDVFKNVVFPDAGIYVYEIKETGKTNLSILTSEYEWLWYSDAVYTLTVYVDNKSDGGTYVYALGTRVLVPDNKEQKVGDKVDPTPGGNKVEYFWSQMVFTNDYVKVNDTKELENDDSTLSIKKRVDGILANKNQYFDFKITLILPSIHQDALDNYKAYIVEEGKVIHPGNNASTAIISIDPDDPYINISAGGTTSFKLKDEQELVFLNLPVGTTYVVEEEATVNYIPGFVVYREGNVVKSEKEKDSHVALATGNQLIGEKDNRTIFTNTRDTVIPTGINLNNLPFIVMMILGIGALGIYVVTKTRKNRYGDEVLKR